MSSLLPTQYAPGERLNDAEVIEQTRSVRTEIKNNQFMDAIPDILTILNEQRQVVYANTRLYELFNTTEKEIIGMRPGEILDCVHASESRGGCGTTAFCRECGAVNAILESQQSKQSIRECRILSKGGKAYDLRVWASPVMLSDQQFTVFSFKDIRHEKRRAALERTFFHDILNTAGIVHGASELLKKDMNKSTALLDMISRGSEQLVDEIKSQRQLLEAERGEMELSLQKINPLELIHRLASAFKLSDVAKDKYISVEATSATTSIKTDSVLLGRVLSNLLKNALEASKPGEMVRVGCTVVDEGMQFFVNNNGFMPRKVQLQVFLRSFSTKGAGRGIGTYSVKLFVEKFLGGQVWFETSQSSGTTFYFTLPLTLGPQA